MQTGTEASYEGLTAEKAKWMYQKMQEIRQFENAVHGIFEKGEIPGFVHLYAGEEAVAVGVCAHLSDNDSITSTHRGHGHCIAKGCDLDGMMAEIFGRSTDCAKVKADRCILPMFPKECSEQTALSVRDFLLQLAPA